MQAVTDCRLTILEMPPRMRFSDDLDVASLRDLAGAVYAAHTGIAPSQLGA